MDCQQIFQTNFRFADSDNIFYHHYVCMRVFLSICFQQFPIEQSAVRHQHIHIVYTSAGVLPICLCITFIDTQVNMFIVYGIPLEHFLAIVMNL